MIKINKKFAFDDRINVNLMGDFDVSFAKSGFDFEYVEVIGELDEKDLKVHIEKDVVEVIDLARRIWSKDDFPRFSQSISKDDSVIRMVSEFFRDISDLQGGRVSKLGSRQISVNFYMLDNPCRGFTIKSDNLRLTCSNLQLNSLHVKSANLKINLVDNFLVNECDIKVSNIDGTVYFGYPLVGMSIKSGNGKLLINKVVGFEGLMDISGNNVKLKGVPLSGDASVGVFRVKMNNGKVRVTDCVARTHPTEGCGTAG